MDGVFSGARRFIGLVFIACFWLAASPAWAQPATCWFDSQQAELHVDVYDEPATLSATLSGIRLNGTLCSGARLNRTDHVIIQGPGNEITLTGNFVPGLTPEATGASEIEISVVSVGVTIKRTAGDDTVLLSTSGLDVANDGDEDITLVGTAVPALTIDAAGGNDLVDARAYSPIDTAATLHLHGGNGRDIILAPTSEGVSSFLYGEAGADELHGGWYSSIHGGPGRDVLYGGPGGVSFHADPVYDGDDQMYCDPGSTSATFDYSARSVGVTVIFGDSDNGETGTEHDLISCDLPAGSGQITIEGSGRDDVLVGATSLANWIIAGSGNDEVQGGDYSDTLDGGGGDDLLVGGGGRDFLRGVDGNDVLDGGPGNDSLDGQGGSDELYGSDGTDTFRGGAGDDRFFNDDGIAENVSCGGGTDTAQASNDTFSDCEVIE